MDFSVYIFRTKLQENMPKIIKDGELIYVDSKFAQIIPVENEDCIYEMIVDFPELPADTKRLSFRVAIQEGEEPSVEDSVAPTEDQMDFYTKYVPVEILDVSDIKPLDISKEELSKKFSEPVNVVSTSESIESVENEIVAEESVSVEEKKEEKPKKRGRKKKVVEPETATEVQIDIECSCEEQAQEDAKEEKSRKRQKNKEYIDYEKMGGRLVDSIPTPTCTGNVAPTLMATGYENATYKNFYSVGHFPKLAVLEIWEFDEDNVPEDKVSVEPEMTVDPNENSVDSGVINAEDILREPTLTDSEDEGYIDDKYVYRPKFTNDDLKNIIKETEVNPLF